MLNTAQIRGGTPFRSSWGVSESRHFVAFQSDLGDTLLWQQIQVITGVAPRYALALFELADESNLLDAVADDLRTIDAAIEANDDLQRLVRSPVVSRGDAGATMASILDKIKANDLTCKFIGLVTANRRLFALRSIITGYLGELANRRGEVTAEVTSSAVELDQEARPDEIVKRRLEEGGWCESVG